MAQDKKQRDLAASEKAFEARKGRAVAEAREVAMFGDRVVVDASFAVAAERAPHNVKTRTRWLSDRKIVQHFEDGVLVKEEEILLS